MLRTAASTVARRSLLNSKGSAVCLTPKVNFHASSKRDEEATPVEPVVEKGGLFGTGLSEWYALPIGITLAVPALKLDWYVVNEETQLAAVFVAFCVASYTQGGDAIHNALDERAQILMKEHNEAEDKVIDALEQKLDFLKANQNMVNDFEAINKVREETYVSLNAAGAIKPQHDLKIQVERILNMIAQEEATVTEKTKIAIMEEATATVTENFSTSKALKKAALDDAIAQIKGTAKGGVDPVTTEFSRFLKAKAEAASKISGDEELVAQREAMVAKINAVAKSEGFFFELDSAGKPTMKA
jgi:translation initiation factor 2 beta subunit (eIF-2beta)/eIF-5